MATFVFYAPTPQARRSDGINTAVGQGESADVARAAVEALIGAPGSLAGFVAVDVSAPCPPCVIEGAPPVGASSQSVWSVVTRGGGQLRAE